MLKQREVYKRVFSPIAEQRIREYKCPSCGKPKSEWNRRTDWRCCSVECTKEFWAEHVEIRDWGATRSMVFKRDNYTCAMCDKRFVHISKYPPYEGQEFAEKEMLVADHITPIAIGGDEWDINNIQTLCIDCNKIKTAQDMKLIAEARKEQKMIEIGQVRFDVITKERIE